MRDDVVSDIRGAPRLKTINGRSYWYDQHRIGSQTLDRDIGDDGPEMRDHLAAVQALRAQAREAARERARLMRVLRAEGLREVVNDILYPTSTACQWRLPPTDFPPVSSARRYFYDWRDGGLWVEITALASFGCKVKPVKTGRAVTGLRLFWWPKSGSRHESALVVRHT